MLGTSWGRNAVVVGGSTIVFLDIDTVKVFYLLWIFNPVMLNKLRCHACWFSTNQITWSRLLIQIHIINDKQCRFRSVGFFRSQLIWIYTVCKGRVYAGSAGPRLTAIASYHPSCHLLRNYSLFHSYCPIMSLAQKLLSISPLLSTCISASCAKGMWLLVYPL